MAFSILILIVCITKIECQVHFVNDYPWRSAGLSMVWVDGRYRHPPHTIDTFYDRLVGLTIGVPDKKRNINAPVLTTGVMITPILVLTSFNSLRRITQHEQLFQRVYIEHFRGRYFHTYTTQPVAELMYDIPPEGDIYITCARQVVPDFKDDYPSHMIHGPHRPHHDLAVLRIEKPLKLVYRKPLYAFPGYHSKPLSATVRPYHFWAMDPIRTVLAKPTDVLGDTIHFASMGHVNDEHIRQHRFMNMRKYHIDDKVKADCEEWFPREWGHFICLLNIDNFAGIASGGMLFSGELLFGVGSFALFKGTTGVLVFTDIRPYWHLFHRTCTVDDQNLVIPKPSSVETADYYSDLSDYVSD